MKRKIIPLLVLFASGALISIGIFFFRSLDNPLDPKSPNYVGDLSANDHTPPVISIPTLVKMGGTEVEIRADSELMGSGSSTAVIKSSPQASNLYAVEATQLLMKFETVSLKHIPRELNARSR